MFIGQTFCGRNLVVDPCSRERRGALRPVRLFIVGLLFGIAFCVSMKTVFLLLTLLAAAVVTPVWAGAVEKGYSPFAGRTD